MISSGINTLLVVFSTLVLIECLTESQMRQSYTISAGNQEQDEEEEEDEDTETEEVAEEKEEEAEEEDLKLEKKLEVSIPPV